MADPTMSPSKAKQESETKSILSIFIFPLIVFMPILVSFIILHFEQFDPASLPEDHSFSPSITIPVHFDQILAFSERIGEGQLPGQELVCDVRNGLLYIGCEDGWVRRISLRDAHGFTVEKVVDVGGPANIAFTPDGELIIAHEQEGLLKINSDKTIELLTKEAEGIKFGLIDGIDVANDGTVYFTDGTYKYNSENYMLDVLEARPHGRLMSFDPFTKQTVVLIHDLYFANGVSVAPDQNSLVYCETVLRRCKRYHIRGEKKGTIENFVENLPGFPGNIQYDGEGHYWIAFLAGRTASWNAMFKYPILRKILYILDQYVTVPKSMKNSGVLSITLDGQPVALYTDQALEFTTSGLKIGNYLYYGSLGTSYISRIDLTKIGAAHKE